MLFPARRAFATSAQLYKNIPNWKKKVTKKKLKRHLEQTEKRESILSPGSARSRGTFPDYSSNHEFNRRRPGQGQPGLPPTPKARHVSDAPPQDVLSLHPDPEKDPYDLWLVERLGEGDNMDIFLERMRRRHSLLEETWKPMTQEVYSVYENEGPLSSFSQWKSTHDSKTVPLQSSVPSSEDSAHSTQERYLMEPPPPLPQKVVKKQQLGYQPLDMPLHPDPEKDSYDTYLVEDMDQENLDIFLARMRLRRSRVPESQREEADEEEDEPEPQEPTMVAFGKRPSESRRSTQKETYGLPFGQKQKRSGDSSFPVRKPVQSFGLAANGARERDAETRVLETRGAFWGQQKPGYALESKESKRSRSQQPFGLAAERKQETSDRDPRTGERPSVSQFGAASSSRHNPGNASRPRDDVRWASERPISQKHSLKTGHVSSSSSRGQSRQPFGLAAPKRNLRPQQQASAQQKRSVHQSRRTMQESEQLNTAAQESPEDSQLSRHTTDRRANDKRPPNAGSVPLAFQQLFAQGQFKRPSKQSRAPTSKVPLLPPTAEQQVAGMRALEKFISQGRPQTHLKPQPSALEELAEYRKIFTDRQIRDSRFPMNKSHNLAKGPGGEKVKSKDKAEAFTNHQITKRRKKKDSKFSMNKSHNLPKGPGGERTKSKNKEVEPMYVPAPLRTAEVSPNGYKRRPAQPFPSHLHSEDSMKLNAIHARYRNFLEFPDVRTVVDLGAGSGSWSGYVTYKLARNRAVPDVEEKFLPSNECERLRSGLRATPPHTPSLGGDGENVAMTIGELFNPRELHDHPRNRDTIVSVDVQVIPYMNGVHRVHADFLDPATDALIDAALVSSSPSSLSSEGTSESPKVMAETFEGQQSTLFPKVDVVLSDIVPTSSGDRIVDVGKSLEICRRAFEFARCRLRTPNEVGRGRVGVLLLRHLPHPLVARFRMSVLDQYFSSVKYINPKAENGGPEGLTKEAEDRGSYFVCLGFKGADSGDSKRKF